MSFKLENILGLSEEDQSVHKIKTLAFNGRNAVKVALLKWKRDCPVDFKKIMKAIHYAGKHEKKYLINTNYVERCDHSKYGEIYEFRNNKCPLRLMFFFDANDTLIICTNDYRKSDAKRTKSGGQDTAFKRCAQIRDLYKKQEIKDD